MEPRRSLTDAEKSKILAEFITPYVSQAKPGMDIDEYMELLQSSYGAMHYKKIKLGRECDYLFERNPVAKKLGDLYLEENVQAKEFPGVSSAAIQMFIRETIYNLNVPAGCKEFLLEAVRESMLNKTLPLFYAVAHPVKVNPEAGGFRELMPKFGKAKNLGLLESFYGNPELPNMAIYSSLYQAFEAAMLSYRMAGDDTYVNSIWVVSYSGPVQWQTAEHIINKQHFGSLYANNGRAMRLEFAEVDRAGLVPLRGFALGMEDNFTDTWVLGKVDRGVILQYAEDPNGFRAKEKKEDSLFKACRIS